MIRQDYIDIARKLKALAEGAKGAERDNATEKLRSFCSKHNLNEDEYSTEQIRVSVAYKNQEERSLLSNVMCMVMEIDNVKGTDKNGSFSFQCSPYQFELIKDAYSYYRNLYREYCEAILVAMVTRNEIVNTKKSDNPFQMEPMSPEEQKEWGETLNKMGPAPTPEQATEPPADDTATSNGVPQPPTEPPKPTSEAKRQERISRMLFIMEPNKWEAPKPKAKLFLD